MEVEVVMEALGVCRGRRLEISLAICMTEALCLEMGVDKVRLAEGDERQSL